MAGTLNKVILIGNVGRDPEFRNTQEGKEIASFSLATSDSWRDKNGERRERTEWHKVVVFIPQLVDIVKRFVHKGSKIYIEGSLQTRRWLDQASVEKYVTEVLLQSYNNMLILLDSKPRNVDGDQVVSESTSSIKVNEKLKNADMGGGKETETDEIGEEGEEGEDVPF
jgi:single-strand DNA-binding protein